MRKRLSVRSREILFEKGLKEGKNLATGKTKRKTKRTCHAEYLNFRNKVSYILNVKHHQKQRRLNSEMNWDGDAWHRKQADTQRLNRTHESIYRE